MTYTPILHYTISFSNQLIQMRKLLMFVGSNRIPVLALGLLFFLVSPNYAQKKAKKKKNKVSEAYELDEDFLFNDSIPNLEYEMTEEEIGVTDAEVVRKKKKKKKEKKALYYGLKGKKGFVRRGTSSSVTTEVFRFVEAKYLMDDAYQIKIHYYDPKTRKIRVKNYFDLKAQIKKGRPIYLLHGKYSRYRNKILRSEGYFYKGLQHGKWWEFDGKGILTEKIRYDLGHTKESEITYYDPGKTKIKEIVPIMHGSKNGMYYRFYENGVMAVQGEYEYDKRVKLWRHWFETRQRQKHVQYPIRWNEQKDERLLREWDTKGKLIYDLDRGGNLNK